VVGLASCCGAAASSLFMSLSNQGDPAFLRPVDASLRSLLLFVPPLFANQKILCGSVGKRSRYLYVNTAFGIGVAAASSGALLRKGFNFSSWRIEGHLPFGLFMGSLCFYHLAEYLLVAYYNPTMLSIDSFLVQQEYVCAMAFSCCEYFLESYFFPGLKGWAVPTWLGLAGVAFGETFRKGALIQAGHNFTHLISNGSKRQEHQLVTHGVYSVSRHPGYFGWFWWSISSQVLLSNPVSVVLFSAASWHFFNDRIPYEEAHLSRFFPEYSDYKQRVPTRIPWIP